MPEAKGGPQAAGQEATQAAKAAPSAAKPSVLARFKEGLRAERSGPELIKTRRRFVGIAIGAFLTTNFLMFLRFFFPRTIFEPKTVFRIGSPGDFGLGVDTRFQKSRLIWVVRNPDRLFVIFARCTHLGCTPDWKESENKFKCPCHGSGYDPEGRNYEGPAPRPMDRARVQIDAEGQIVVDTAVLFKEEKGKTSQFNEEGSYVAV
jgi:cytochrome b6-f complex iron-sulfur subunit